MPRHTSSPLPDPEKDYAHAGNLRLRILTHEEGRPLEIFVHLSDYLPATASISTLAPFGRAATW